VLYHEPGAIEGQCCECTEAVTLPPLASGISSGISTIPVLLSILSEPIFFYVSFLIGRVVFQSAVLYYKKASKGAYIGNVLPDSSKKGRVMKVLLYVVILCIVFSNAVFSQSVKRKFLLSDEGNNNIVYVDQLDYTKNWKFPVGNTSRSLQLIGKNRLLVGTISGDYFIIDITTGKQVKKGSFNPAAQASSLYLLENGHFVGAYETGSDRTVFEADSTGKVLKTVKFTGLTTLRQTTFTQNNTFLFGSDNIALECNWDGKVVWADTLTTPNTHVWKVLRLPNGNTVFSIGYQASLLVVTPDKKIIKTIGGTNQPGKDTIHPNFFAGFQLLKNGHFAVTNWQNHGTGHGSEGVQILEYDSTGLLVWSFKDPALYSSVHNLIFLDSLDIQLPHDERMGYVSPVISTPVNNYRPVVPVKSSQNSVISVNNYGFLLSGRRCPVAAATPSAAVIITPALKSGSNGKSSATIVLP